MEQSIHSNHSTEWHSIVSNFKFVIFVQSSREYQRNTERCELLIKSFLRNHQTLFLIPQVISAIDEISLSYVGNEHLHNVITESCIEKYNKGIPELELAKKFRSVLISKIFCFL